MLLKICDKIWLILRFIDWHIIECMEDIPFDVRYYWRHLLMVLSYIKPIAQYNTDYSVANGLFEIMIHKLRRAEKEMCHLVYSEQYKKEINWTIDRLEEIASNKFNNDASEAHRKRWGVPIIVNRPDVVLMYPKVKSQEEHRKARKELVKMCREASNQRKEQLQKVMLFIAERADYWRD